MATLPVSVDEIIAKWGPHKHYMTKDTLLFLWVTMRH